MPVNNIISDGVFSTTKSHAQKGKLLNKANLENLSEAKGLNDLVTRLKATVYDEAVSRIKDPISAHKVEMAANEHLADVHFNLMRISPHHEVLHSYYLRYITSNLKTVLKGKALGRSFESIQGYIGLYAEELIGRRDLVTRVLASENLEEAVGLLERSDFYEDIRDAVVTYKENGRLDVFDVYLDKAFYSKLSQVYAKHYGGKYLTFGRSSDKIYPLIAADIDSHNAISILRAKSWGLPVASIRSLIIEPTFDIPVKLLYHMSGAEDMIEASKFLERTPYRKIFPSSVPEGEIIASLEDSFRTLAFERAYHPFLWNVDSEALPLGLIRLKELEIRNIAAIAFGVGQGMSGKEISSKINMPKR